MEVNKKKVDKMLLITIKLSLSHYFLTCRDLFTKKLPRIFRQHFIINQNNYKNLVKHCCTVLSKAHAMGLPHQYNKNISHLQWLPVLPNYQTLHWA